MQLTVVGLCQTKELFKRKEYIIVKQNEIAECESESLYKMESINLTRPNKPEVKKQWVTKLTFGTNDQEYNLKCQQDTGAMCNVLHLKDYNKMHMGKNMYNNVDTSLKQSDTSNDVAMEMS